jgi:class 3 adenylate cyclase
MKIMKRLTALIGALLISIMLISAASAEFSVKLQKESIDGATDGLDVNIPAVIENTGQCSLSCYYRIGSSIKKNVVDELKPLQNYGFDIDFQVHACGQKSCPGYIDFACKEQANGESCSNKTYEETVSVQLTNIKENSEIKAPLENQISNRGCWCEDNGKCESFECKSCKDCGGKGCFCEDNGKCEERECPECRDCLGGENESGSLAEHVGQFIGIALVVIVAIALFILLIFGFYRLIRFLFLRKNKEEKEDEGKRKLSAIMFTDMKGFSKEMGEDEEKTLKKLWRYERAMKSIIKEHDGRVVKTIGDAIMGDFDSAVNSVKAAMDIQSLLKKEDIKIRIGIHLGDVIHKGGDIFGDGVNIASRIESICEPGEIYISEDTYNQVKGKIRATFENLGKRPLKNIESPPKVYKIK